MERSGAYYLKEEQKISQEMFKELYHYRYYTAMIRRTAYLWLHYEVFFLSFFENFDTFHCNSTFSFSRLYCGTMKMRDNLSSMGHNMMRFYTWMEDFIQHSCTPAEHNAWKSPWVAVVPWPTANMRFGRPEVSAFSSRSLCTFMHACILDSYIENWIFFVEHVTNRYT